MPNERETNMLTTAILLVLASGFLHAIWNLYTKKSINKNVFLWYCQWISILVFLPWALFDLYHVDLSFPPIGYLLLLSSMLLHGIYMLLLAQTYSIGDLSQVYPIMRGTSPLLVPMAGVFLLNESLSFVGWTGVLLIVLGIFFLSEIGKGGQPASLKATLLAFGVGLCIASYIVVDKLALEYLPPVLLNEATNIGNMIALSWGALRSGGTRTEWKINWRFILIGGAIAPLGYLLFLFALSLAPVAQLAPMREIGTVFGTLLGIYILREQQGGRRIFASVLIALGIILLGIWG